jgi:hypothetical protein
MFIFFIVFYNQPKFCPNATWNTAGTTFAGNTIAGSLPQYIFVDNNSTVYVSYVDDAKRVSVWMNDSHTPTRNISDGVNPIYSLFVTPNGDIYTDDAQKGHIDRWILNNTKHSITIQGVDKACYGLFVDINDTLYYSVKYGHGVWKRSLKYNESNCRSAAGNGFSGAASNQLNGPHGIFVDTKFNLYVADCYNNRIQVFKSEEPNGTVIQIRDQNNMLNCSTDVVLDHDLNLYVADNGNHRILRFKSNSNESHCLVGCADSSGNGPDRLKNPISISFDSHGGIYVTDSNNHRVQKFSLATNSCGKKRIFSCRTNNYS